MVNGLLLAVGPSAIRIAHRFAQVRVIYNIVVTCRKVRNAPPSLSRSCPVVRTSPRPYRVIKTVYIIIIIIIIFCVCNSFGYGTYYDIGTSHTFTLDRHCGYIGTLNDVGYPWHLAGAAADELVLRNGATTIRTTII